MSEGTLYNAAIILVCVTGMQIVVFSLTWLWLNHNDAPNPPESWKRIHEQFAEYERNKNKGRNDRPS